MALDSIQSCDVTMERRAEDGVAVRALLWGVPRWVHWMVSAVDDGVRP